MELWKIGTVIGGIFGFLVFLLPIESILYLTVPIWQRIGLGDVAIGHWLGDIILFALIGGIIGTVCGKWGNLK